MSNLLAGSMRPVAIFKPSAPEFARTVAALSSAEARGSVPDFPILSGAGATRFVGDRTEKDANGRPVAVLPYKRTPEGVAIITIDASLINRGQFIGSFWGIASYEGLSFQLESAAKDPKVRAIVLDLNSPGGEAAGAFETAALVRKVSSEKPVYASINSMAASAGYALASGSKAIFTTESGSAGSIGVILAHFDYSRALDRAGVSPTFIDAPEGGHKTDGSPYAQLSESVKADLQAEVSQLYELFVGTVADGRKSMSKKKIRDTQARVYIGRAAMDAGLVDGIGSFSDVLGSLSKASARSTKGNAKMNMHNDEDLARARAEGHSAGMAEGRTAGHAAGAEEARATATAEGHKAGLAEGLAAGTKAERERIKSLLGHADAKGREATAQHLALTTDMTVEAAVGVLAGVPKVTSIAGRAESTILNAGPFVDTGEAAQAGAPAQAGAVSWDSVADKLNAERKRSVAR